MSNEEAVRTAFAKQAEWCVHLGSPFTALLCDLLGRALDRSTRVGRRVLDWPGQPDSNNDAVPLRFAGGLHALVRRGRLPGLAVLYPPASLPEPDVLWSALDQALRDADAELAEWLDRTPQTNEVGRSSALMAGLLVLTAQYDRPVALYELGPSAGLNLMLDRFRFRLGETDAGDPASPLFLQPDWEGASPPAAAVRVVGRRGVDPHPLDVTDAGDRERLLAYVWPDQQQRLGDLGIALMIAQADPPVIDQGDAASWLEANLALTGAPGVTRVVTHTIAIHYFPPETRRRVETHLAQVGAAATEDSPFAWLRFEFDPAANNLPTLFLTIWPGGEEQKLAVGHPHGRWIRWLGGAMGGSQPLVATAGQRNGMPLLPVQSQGAIVTLDLINELSDGDAVTLPVGT